MIKTIIIDDERRSRKVLAELLSFIPDASIAAEAENADIGVREIRKLEPDLIFLDIEMPLKSGFDLLKEIQNDPHIPDIIFVTAYDRYAIEAFKFAAFDYLLKPINRIHLKETLDRYQVSKTKNTIPDKLTELFQYMEEPKKLVFDLRTGLLILDPIKLVYCLADGNYTYLHLEDGRSEVVSFNLGYVEKKLQTFDFFRLNRSVLINTEHILKLDLKNKACEIKFNGEYLKFKVSQEKMSELKVLFS